MTSEMLIMNLPTLNSEYCYMLTSCDFASTIGDLTKITAKQGSMHPLDIVKQAVQELLEGREHELSPNEQDDMKLSLARLLLCLCLKARLKNDEELAEFLDLFPEMGEDFVLAVVMETGLTQAFVQNLCELEPDTGRPILELMTSSLVDPAQLFLTVVRLCHQFSKLVANKNIVPVAMATQAHSYLRHHLSMLKPPQSDSNVEIIGEFISLLDAYVDAYCVKERRRQKLTSLYNVDNDADTIFGELFMLSHGLYVDTEIHVQLDANANKLLSILDALIHDIDMAKVKAESVDFYRLWTESRRIRQVLRQSDDKSLASKIEKFESRLRYRLLKASKFSEDTKLDDCLFLLGKNLHRREITGVLIDMLGEAAHNDRIVPFLDQNLILLCDPEFIVKLIRVTRLTKIQLKSKKCRQQLCDLLKRAFVKSNARTQNDVILGAHQDGVQTITFDVTSKDDCVNTLNRLTLTDDVTSSTFSNVAWLILQKPREVLEQMITLASSNSDYCKVVQRLLNTLPSIGLVQIGEEHRLSNLVHCIGQILKTELTEQQDDNLINLYIGLVNTPSLNTRQLVQDVVLRSVNVEAARGLKRSAFNFSLALLENLIETETLWPVANTASIVAAMYCVCELIDFSGQYVHLRRHSSLKERCKNIIFKLCSIWIREQFDGRVTEWIMNRIDVLHSELHFLFYDFAPYPQKRLKSTLIRSTINLLQAKEPKDIHRAVLTIFSVACVSDKVLEYYTGMSGECRVPYSVLVTSIVQRLQCSTLDELVRLYGLLREWLARGTIHVRDRRIAVTPFVCKILTDAVMVVIHPDMGWIESSVKTYVIRNHALILKRILTDLVSEPDDRRHVLDLCLELMLKLDSDLAEPLLILSLDAIKNLKSQNVDLSSLKTKIGQTDRKDVQQIIKNL